MSLVPTFEIRLLNAWILTVVFLLLVYVPLLVLKYFSKKMGQGEHYGKVETCINVLFFILVLSSVFLPLKLRTAWLYIGLLVYLLGIIIVALTIMYGSTTPLGKPFTKGIYRYSKNPGYIGQIIVFVGIGVATASWIYVLLFIILAVPTFLLISVEERITLYKLGDSYR